MSHVVEETVKALVEFEAALDGVRAESTEAKKRMIKDSAEWAASAKSNAIARAQEIAARRLAEARKEAEAEAVSIGKKGDAEMKKFEESISRRKKEAAELVTKRLLGESG
jgi:vacuolar-type H+-ATPase subunit H